MRVFFTLAVFASALLYASGLQAPLYLDDSYVIEIAQTGSSPVRPLGYASFWVTDQLARMGRLVFPWTYGFYHRFPNVLIHALAATALFCLALELTGRWPLAAVAGMLFLAHPIQTQAVTYISQRFESMAACFMLLAAAAYARFRNTGRLRWILGALAGALIAGLIKETAVSLPFWLFLMEYVFYGRQAVRRRTIYFALFFGLISISALGALGSSGRILVSVPWRQYLVSQGLVLTTYLRLSIWPRNQFLFYDAQLVETMTTSLILQWLLVAGLIGLSFFLLRPKPLISFGLLSFFILLLPVTLFPLPDLIFEHRVYPAFAGLALAAAGIIEAVPARRRRWAFVAAGVVIALLSIRTIRRNAEWNDEVAFMEAHRARFPDSPDILTRLGSTYLFRGEVNKALAVTEEARRHEDRFNDYYRHETQLLIAINLASLYMAKQDLDAAKGEGLRAVSLDPESSFALGALGGVQIARGEYVEARQTFEKLTKLYPSEPTGWNGLRAALLGLRDIRGARDAARREAQESQKSAGKAVPFLVLSEFKTPIIFGATVLMLVALVLSFRTVWMALVTIFDMGLGRKSG